MHLLHFLNGSQRLEKINEHKLLLRTEGPVHWRVKRSPWVHPGAVPCSLITKVSGKACRLQCTEKEQLKLSLPLKMLTCTFISDRGQSTYALPGISDTAYMERGLVSMLVNKYQYLEAHSHACMAKSAGYHSLHFTCKYFEPSSYILREVCCAYCTSDAANTKATRLHMHNAFYYLVP